MGAGEHAIGTGGYCGVAIGANSATTVEAKHYTRMTVAGTFSNMSTQVFANAAGNDELRLRDNNVSQPPIISITGATTGNFEDDVNTDTVVAGRNFDYLLTGGGTIRCENSILFDADSSLTVYYGGTRSQGFSSASSTRYMGISGMWLNFNGTTESTQQTKIKVAGTWKKLGCQINTTRATATEFRSRVNGIDGNQVVSVTSTGFFEDTTNTDTVSVDDLLDYDMTTGTGVDVIDPEVTKSEILYTGVEWNHPCERASGDATVQTPNITNYFGLSSLQRITITEASIETQFPFKTLMQEMQAHVTANSITTSATDFKVRKNQADGNQVISVAAAASGYFVDATNTDSFNDEDDFAWEVATPNTSGSITYNMLSVTMGEDITNPIKSIDETVQRSEGKLVHRGLVRTPFLKVPI